MGTYVLSTAEYVAGRLHDVGGSLLSVLRLRCQLLDLSVLRIQELDAVS